MNNFNSLILEGVVKGEPHYVESVGVLKCTIAVERSYKDRDGNEVTEVSQFKVVCSGRLAEFANSHIKDGVGVRVVGRLKENKWSDGDGVKHSGVEIVAEHIEYKNLSKKGA